MACVWQHLRIMRPSRVCLISSDSPCLYKRPCWLWWSPHDNLAPPPVNAPDGDLLSSHQEINELDALLDINHGVELKDGALKIATCGWRRSFPTYHWILNLCNENIRSFAESTGDWLDRFCAGRGRGAALSSPAPGWSRPPATWVSQHPTSFPASHKVVVTNVTTY